MKWSTLTHLLVRVLVRVTLVGALLLGGIGSIPFVASWAERQGVPAPRAGLATTIVFVGAWLLYTLTTPVARRRRVMKGAAKELDLRFRRGGWRIPHSWVSLPSFTAPDIVHSVIAIAAGHRAGGELVVFDDLWVPEGGFRGHVLTRAMLQLKDLKVPAIALESLGTGGRVPGIAGLQQYRTESEEFNDRYRVHAEDPRAASAFLDQRLMAWLLQLRGLWSFEIAGHWAACSAPEAHSERIRYMLAVLEEFTEHVPRVVGSLYPEPGPRFG